MFSIYALLGDKSPALSNERLEAELRKLFRSDKELSVQHQRLLDQPVLGLRWGDWYLAQVSYEEGERVCEDSQVIAGVLNMPSLKIQDITRRIRAVFYDNEAHDYTNEIILIIDYMCGLEGAIVLDPHAESLWPHPRMEKLKSSNTRG